MNSDRLVSAFLWEHRARYRIVEERKWQEDYEKASLAEKCTMLMLKQVKSWAVEIFTDVSARFGYAKPGVHSSQ